MIKQSDDTLSRQRKRAQERAVAKAKKRFGNFLFLVWDHLNLPAPSNIQYDIADYLQYGPDRMIIEAFRGIGKSWITGAFVCWCLLVDPNERILVVSASKDRADSFSIFVKRLIADMPLLQHLRPDPSKGDRDSNVMFDVAPAPNDQSPSVKSVGITGQMVGSRASKIIADDVEVTKNSLTATQRSKLLDLVREFDAILKPGGQIKYLGTPQTEQSVYNELPNRGYEVRIWPARVPDGVEKYKGRLAPIIVDMAKVKKARTCTEPTRFDDVDLRGRELSWGKSGFGLQYMLDTSLSDSERYPLKLADLLVMSMDPARAPAQLSWASGDDNRMETLPSLGFTGDFYHKPMWLHETWMEYTGCVMTIDPSGRGKDETAYAITKFLNGYIYVMDVGGLSEVGYSPAALNKLALIAKRWGVNEIIVEKNFGDGMFNELLKPALKGVHPCEITETTASNQMNKERRIIDVLEPVMNQHRLVVSPSVIQDDYDSAVKLLEAAGSGDGADVASKLQYSLFHQMTRITKEKGSLGHDDRLDALAMAVAYWVESMSADAEENLEAAREEAMSMSLEEALHGPGWEYHNARMGSSDEHEAPNLMDNW